MNARMTARKAMTSKMTKLITIATATLLTAAAQASTFTMVDCLSESTNSDVTVHLSEVTKTEFAQVFARALGTSSEITYGRVETYTSTRFVYTGVADGKPVRIEAKLNSTESKNGKVTIGNKTERAQCFVSDTTLED